MTKEELARQTQEALANYLQTRTPEQQWEDMIQWGLIDRKGDVVVGCLPTPNRLNDLRKQSGDGENHNP